MEMLIKSTPNNWRHRLIVPAVPKDGTPLEESFSLSLDKPVSYWAQVYSICSPLEVEVSTSRTEGRLLTVISVRTEATLPCSRCLEPATVSVSGELKYLFSLRPDEIEQNRERGEQDGEEEIIALDSWEDGIDLAPMIWEALITSLPGAALCSADCMGLCPQCGSDLNKSSCECVTDNADPRFEVLRSFVKNKRNS